MHIYKWHTIKLKKKKKRDMLPYLEYIEENHGCDPEYPQIDLIFRDEEQARENMEFADFIADLGQERQLTGSNNVSCKQLLNEYIQEHPDTAELITDYQQQVISGVDRKWSIDYIQQLDRLDIHRLLLRSVIRGIGTMFSMPGKSSGFNEWFIKYGRTQLQMSINIKTSFIMPVKQIVNSSVDQDTIARKQINLLPVEKAWISLCNSDPLNTGNVLPFINKWTIELNEPLENGFNEKISL
jgi:hypothetical protein